MTTEESKNTPDAARLNANLARIDELSQRLLAAFGNKRQSDKGLQGPGADFLQNAGGAMWADMLADPARLMESQVSYWAKSLKNFADAQGGVGDAVAGDAPDDAAKDRRFSDPQWETNPYFNYAKRQYQLNAEVIGESVAHIQGLTAADQKRLEYFSGQIVDMFSPANFLATNPVALNRALETEGQSLIDGLENLVRDVEANDGEVVLTLSDKDAFQVGGNIATSPGSVVFRNRMFELIQYAPSTQKVHKIPLIIFPPWINKFYILDLKEKNSLIKWITDQGFTLFMVSWVNPDAAMSDVGMDEYVDEGFLTAIDQVKKITGQKQVNAVGYCIAGATLSLTLALMKKRGDNSVASATFFTTLTDFTDAGEVSVFLGDDFVDAIEREVADRGILHASFLSRTFSFLRSNDLIYAPAIRSYMMGQAPPAFDLLYWNGDGTNLPAAMATEYLRRLCQQNLFSNGAYPMAGETLSIADVDVPLCAIACETDHIAPWISSFEGVSRMGSKDKTFILSESGHVAGIVNPPGRKKYGHYTNADMGMAADAWQQGAEFHEGSWWPRWGEWLAGRSGTMVKAPKPGGKDYSALCDAPGTYVVATPKA